MRFVKEDRQKVVALLEKTQKSPLSRIEGRQLFADASGVPFLIFGGKSTWHGMRPQVADKLREMKRAGGLVVAKKYTSRIDVCIGSLAEFTANLRRLNRNKDGEYHFHITVEEDGLAVTEIPGLMLNRIGEIPLTVGRKQMDLRRYIGEIVDLEVEHGGEVSHSDIQAKLILVGSYLGYRTFTPDRSKESAYGVLGELCTEQAVPEAFVAPQLIQDIKTIDVIWFDDEGFPTHGFEVEHTTDVTKGMLRLYRASKLKIRMFIIADESKRGRFESELEKSPFRNIKDKYVFKNYRELDGFFDSVKQSSQLRKTFLEEGK